MGCDTIHHIYFLMFLPYPLGGDERKHWEKYVPYFGSCEVQTDSILWLLADEWGISSKDILAVFI